MEWAQAMVSTNRRWWAPWRVEQGSAIRRADSMIGRSRRAWSSKACSLAHPSNRIDELLPWAVAAKWVDDASAKDMPLAA
jgi:hypothetical protein